MIEKKEKKPVCTILINFTTEKICLNTIWIFILVLKRFLAAPNK